MVDVGDSQPDPLDNLSEIDKQILRLVAQGRSSKEIGKELHRSPLTIDGRLKDVCVRVGAENRVQAASMLLLREAQAVPPNSGVGQSWGIDLEGEPTRRGGEDDARSRGGAASPKSTGWVSSLLESVRSLIVGGRTGTEEPVRRMIRIGGTILVVAATIALTSFLLATALQAFQGVVLGIRS